MDIIHKENMVRLFDIYCELLTEHQKEIFTSYYIDDLSLMEIAENENVSRNAIFSIIHRVEKQLLNYDEKLHLKEKFDNIYDLLKDSKVSQEVIEKFKDIVEEES